MRAAHCVGGIVIIISAYILNRSVVVVFNSKRRSCVSRAHILTLPPASPACWRYGTREALEMLESRVHIIVLSRAHISTLPRRQRRGPRRPRSNSNYVFICSFPKINCKFSIASRVQIFSWSRPPGSAGGLVGRVFVGIAPTKTCCDIILYII